MTDRAVWLCEYLPWLATGGVTKGPTPTRLAGNNFAVRKSWVDTLKVDEIHECEIQGWAGQKIAVANRSAVRHVRTYTLREAFADRWRFGRDYGQRRGRRSRPMVCLAGFVVGPAVLAAQVTRLVTTLVAKRCLGSFAADLPLTVALLSAWSAGEWLGWSLAAIELLKTRCARRPRETADRIAARAIPQQAGSRPHCTADRGGV
jgi:hypothetical protein